MDSKYIAPVVVDAAVMDRGEVRWRFDLVRKERSFQRVFAVQTGRLDIVLATVAGHCLDGAVWR